MQSRLRQGQIVEIAQGMPAQGTERHKGRDLAVVWPCFPPDQTRAKLLPDDQEVVYSVRTSKPAGASSWHSKSRLWLAIIGQKNRAFTCSPAGFMSNNDGCVVARGAEIKALGAAMGAPWFQIKDLARKHGIVALSSNYELYADLSNRMMGILGQYSPDQEIYSIDECFLGMGGFELYDLMVYGKEIRQKVRQWVGLPVCDGFAQTKMLATHKRLALCALANGVRCIAHRRPIG
jgi:impB/mucB/samB family